MEKCESSVTKQLVNHIRDYYQTTDLVPLHEPNLNANEKLYVEDAISSTFVSSVGAYVDKFETSITKYTGSEQSVATVNGTAALHVALKLAGVESGDLVITQSLTFVATCNAISYCGAYPLFIDVDLTTLSLSAVALQEWLGNNAKLNSLGVCVTKKEARTIKACVPMHTFGHPADLDNLMRVANKWNIAVVEDAAESLGSKYKGKHTGTFGVSGALSFNGNKIITTGGGGMILTNELLGPRAKHLTTTAKIPHKFEYNHDEIGFNYRMPNLNAAMGCAQLEQLDKFLTSKRKLAKYYEDFFKNTSMKFVSEPQDCDSNYWLNAIICESKKQRDHILKTTNKLGVMTRPIWSLMHTSKMYRNCLSSDLSNSDWLAHRIVNLPSSVTKEPRVE